MRVETITCVYNEEFLLPFYLQHYSWVDRVNIIFDIDTNDASLRRIVSYSKSLGLDVKLTLMDMPEGMDNIIKINNINWVYKQLPADSFALLVDADEFVLVDREKLEQIKDLVTVVYFGHVYRHVDEEDLDPTKPIKEQRRHGFISGRKPIVVRGGLDASWDVGCHECSVKPYNDIGLVLAHWCMADPCFCIDRRYLDRVLRYSDNNKKHGFSTHISSATRESLLAECRQHENDAAIW